MEALLLIVILLLLHRWYPDAITLLLIIGGIGLLLFLAVMLMVFGFNNQDAITSWLKGVPDYVWVIGIPLYLLWLYAVHKAPEIWEIDHCWRRGRMQSLRSMRRLGIIRLFASRLTASEFAVQYRPGSRRV